MKSASFDPNFRPPVLTGSRLWLRPIELADAESLFAAARNPNVTRFTLWEAHRSRDDTEQFIRTYAAERYLHGEPDPLGIVLRDGERHGPVVGCVGGHWVSRDNRVMEIGFWIAEPLWGRGLIAEAGQLLIEHLFAAYDVERVQAHCMAENVASARVLEKLGLRFEGTHRSALFHRGRFWDLKMFAVLRNDLHR